MRAFACQKQFEGMKTFVWTKSSRSTIDRIREDMGVWMKLAYARLVGDSVAMVHLLEKRGTTKKSSVNLLVVLKYVNMSLGWSFLPDNLHAFLHYFALKGLLNISSLFLPKPWKENTWCSTWIKLAFNFLNWCVMVQVVQGSNALVKWQERDNPSICNRRGVISHAKTTYATIVS